MLSKLRQRLLEVKADASRFIDLWHESRKAAIALKSINMTAPFHVEERADGVCVCTSNRIVVVDCFGWKAPPQALAICNLLNALPWDEF